MERINKLEAFLEKQPNDSFLQHALALEYVKTGNDEVGKRIFENLLERDSGYVGSYYHLAKLLERMNDTDAAIEVYERGIAIAKAAGDNHAKNELQMALDEIVD